MNKMKDFELENLEHVLKKSPLNDILDESDAYLYQKVV